MRDRVIIVKNVEEEMKVFKTLRIICCIICALIVLAAFFIFVYLGMLWGFISLLGAAAFFGLMMLFKSLQEKQERKDNPPPPTGDFITGRVPTDENEKKN